MREMSVAEQRYQAVLAVISDGRTVTEVAGQWKVSRQTLHGWLARYEAAGLEGLSADNTLKTVGVKLIELGGVESRTEALAVGDGHVTLVEPYALGTPRTVD